MQKPDVDQIDGLSPAISIEQKTTSKNPRSTVGTVTEIYDYMRLLWARVGVPYSPATGLPIESQTVSQMVDRVLALPEGTRLYLLAPVVRGRKGSRLKKSTWAGAVDNLGGDILAWLLAASKIAGTVAAVGLAANMKLNTTVAPFILRGVRLLGTDSANTSMSLRQTLWNKLAVEWRPDRVHDEVARSTSTSFRRIRRVSEGHGPRPDGRGSGRIRILRQVSG